MRLARLDVTFDELTDPAVLIADDGCAVVVRVLDADTATVVGGVGASWSGSWGVWLEASDAYSAALIARDVKTLAALVALEHVVIDAAAHAAAHAEVVVALLSDDEVNLRNEVAHLTHAYNRPAPAHAPTVWYVQGDTLVHAARVVRRGVTRGAVTFFED